LYIAAAGPSNVPPANSRNFHFEGDEDEEEEEEEGEEEDEDEEGEDQDDLETAFGILDSARTILSKIDTKEAKAKLASVRQLLGDVATESGIYTFVNVFLTIFIDKCSARRTIRNGCHRIQSFSGGPAIDPPAI
jgi:hypothetical protein